jgi:hypothetical protein
MSEIERLLAEFRALVDGRDRALQRELIRRWARVERALAGQLDALVRELAELRAAGQPVTPHSLYRLERYQTLLAQVQEETRRYAESAAGLIAAEQGYAVQLGLDWGRDSVAALTVRTHVGLALNRVNARAVEAMIGLAADGTPLAQLLTRSYPQTVAAITDTLIEATALGYNPRRTARLLRDEMAGEAQRALVVARTEQSRALRAATVETYRQSGSVATYTRRAARSGRTCLACLLEDGRQYPVTVTFSDHPNGRCVAIADVPGVPSPVAQSGREWFMEQPAEVQRRIMGEGHYQAWREGEYSLGEASRMHQHPVWGDAPQVVPLRELVGRHGAQYAAAAG